MTLRELQTPVNFHHMWVGDERHGAYWLPPAIDHFTALFDSWFDGEVRVGLVGGAAQRAEAAEWVGRHRPEWILAAEADEGYEMVTLEALHQFAKEASPDTPILYTHGKGSFQAGEFADAWRKNMTNHVVGRWKHCVNSLHTVDAVGCHWLTSEEYPGKIFQPGIFGGNFWWASAGYLAGLPPLEYASRWCAEGWVGLNSPRVECLVEGWPEY